MLAAVYLLAGAAAVLAGVTLLVGFPWALLTGGVMLLALGVLEARGPAPVDQREPVGAVRALGREVA